MFWILLASIFLFGLAVGSFVNVVIYRTLHGESPFSGRSKCPSCGKTIRAVDNIPLLSYLFLHGRCRNCKARISWSYPVVELLTGILFVWWYVGGSAIFTLSQSPFIYIQPLFWLLVGVLLLVIFFTDLLYGVIPDEALWILGGMALFYRVFLTTSGIMQTEDFWRSLMSGVVSAALFLLLILGTEGKGMGMGDAKLVFVLGLLLGWPRILVALFVSFMLGALVAGLLLMTRMRRFGQTVPFGPFLVVGTGVALVWGPYLVTRFFPL